jgi:hypothetical protein
MTYQLKKEQRLLRQQQQTDDNNNRPLFFERKIDEVTAGLRPEYSRLLYSLAVQNAFFIADYILSMKTELNLSDNYREGVIKLLGKISKHHKNCHFHYYHYYRLLLLLLLLLLLSIWTPRNPLNSGAREDGITLRVVRHYAVLCILLLSIFLLDRHFVLHTFDKEALAQPPSDRCPWQRWTKPI